MGLMGKLKNILFEEEEVEIPVIEKKEKKPAVEYKEYKEPVKEEVRNAVPDYSNFYDDLEPVINKEKVMEEKAKAQEVVSEREMFKTEKTFNFPAFDEEEFKSVVPKQRTTNVMDYERKKTEKRNDYKRVERREEPKETKVKFKPSPIISPVYGILDKNYTPDEITTRTDSVSNRTLDVDSVRKKAFGSLEEKQEVKVSKESLDDKILEEKLEKARTIDELLKDSSDDFIEIDEEVVINQDKFENTNHETYDEDIDLLLDVEPKHEASEEDTLESDLFDLIDSMYENREDGE